jgi:uncharacterized protein (DUF2267 family)
MDKVINDILKQSGLTPPKEGVFMDGARAYAWEELYVHPEDGGSGGGDEYEPGNGNDDLGDGPTPTAEDVEEIKRELIQARQAAKSQGKMIGALYSMLERAFNDVLPDTCEFAFKVQDPYEVQERAQTASLWAGVVQVLGDKLTPDEARLLLANQIEAVKDAISDASGESARLNDIDPKGEPPPPEITADDASPMQDEAPPASAAPETTADDSTPLPTAL